MAEPILKLTFEDRQKIEINGKLYELLAIDELSFAEALTMERKFKPLESYVTGQGLDPKKMKSVKAVKALGEFAQFLTNTLLQAPPNVRNRLSDLQRSQILQAVFMKPAGTTEPATQNSNASNGKPLHDSPVATDLGPVTG